MTDQARHRLAAAQTVLVRALLAGDAAPPGFDAERLRIESAALLAKRRRVVERQRPDLVDAVGARFAELFATWAAANPRRDGISARADADSFAAWLSSHADGPVPTGRPRRTRRRHRDQRS